MPKKAKNNQNNKLIWLKKYREWESEWLSERDDKVAEDNACRDFKPSQAKPTT